MSSIEPQKDPARSLEWLSLPNDLKNKLITVYEDQHNAIFNFENDRDERLMEAQHNCPKIETQIHKALGAKLQFLSNEETLNDFAAGLKSFLKKGYNIFSIEDEDPLQKEIENHFEKFKTVKKVAIKIAEENLERKQNYR